MLGEYCAGLGAEPPEANEGLWGKSSQPPKARRSGGGDPTVGPRSTRSNVWTRGQKWKK